MRELLSEIAVSTAQSVGLEFLTALVRSIRRAMEAQLVFITTGLGEPPIRARSLVAWERERAREPFEYDLEGTPCRIVYGGETLVISEGLYERFPREAGYQGYIGVPLHGGSDKVSGHLAVLSQNPISNPEEATAIVKLFSMRAEAELQRMEHEREREALISSLAMANRRLHNRQSSLRKSNETKALLLGTLAHDLRNPLAVISTRGELVQSLIERNRAELLDKAKESCDTIMSMAERMDRLISSILKQAQAESRPVITDLQPFPLGRAVDVAIGLNSIAAQSKRIAITADIQSQLVMRGDEDQIVEALDNLISNAIKYSHAGQHVLIHASQDQDVLRITVTDQGQGLTRADRARAFQQFQRLSAKPTAGETSTGLGLAIVKSIAEAHGGTAMVTSAGRDRGATFSLLFPAAAD